MDLGGEYGGSASIFWRTKKYKKKDGEFYGRNNTKHSNQGKYCFFLIVAWVVFLVWQFSIRNNPWIATCWGPSTLRYQLSPEKSWIRPWEDDWRRDLDGE